VKRHPVKGCGCGGERGFILELDAPISKRALSVFKQAGYKTAEMYTRVGVFYVERMGLTANGPFGGVRMQVRCRGAANCHQLMDHLENTFKVAAMPVEQKK
jgi:hypothetical protein